MQKETEETLMFVENTGAVTKPSYNDLIKYLFHEERFIWPHNILCLIDL